VGPKEVGGNGPQAAIAIAMRVQAKKVAAGILESGLDEETHASVEKNMNDLILKSCDFAG
jgi:hypothetical protein